VAGKAAAGGAFRVVEKLAEGLLGIFDPVHTPAQKIEARIAQAERNADAQQQIDFSRYTAGRAIERQREEDAVHRERGRDR
jgi:hypothetical protein